MKVIVTNNMNRETKKDIYVSPVSFEVVVILEQVIATSGETSVTGGVGANEYEDGGEIPSGSDSDYEIKW